MPQHDSTVPPLLGEAPAAATPPAGAPPTPRPRAADSRRQFVGRLAVKAAYVAPVVVTLAASRKAFAGSAPSGVS